MGELMKAAVLEKKGLLKVREIPLPSVGELDVLIRVMSCGLCGTDLKLFKGEYAGSLPVVPGHEIAGTVVQVGKKVGAFRKNDKVVIDPNRPCGQCMWCRTGKGRFCEQARAFGVTENGGFGEYIAVPEGQVHRITRGLDYVSASLTEPLSCAVHAVDRAAIAPGTSIAIIGGGFQGQLLLQLAAARGAGPLIMVTRSSEKLELAKRLGATHAVKSDSRAQHKVVQLTGGGVDVVLETAGTPETMEMAVRILKKGGTAVAYGLCSLDQRASFSPFAVTSRELAIIGSWLSTPESFREAIRLLERRVIDAKALVSHTFTVGESPKGFSLMREKPRRFIKAVMVGAAVAGA